MTVQLNWKKCGDDHHWCNLANLTLTNNSDVGVYIIWHSGNPGRVVRLGQGVIKDRLTERRENPNITKYGEIFVTWAVVGVNSRDGIERYLADKWKPLVGYAFPDAPPIEVNSPFAA